MADNSTNIPQPALESIGWNQSDTLKSLIGIIVTQVVNIIANLALLFGHPLSADAQLALTNGLLGVSTLVCILLALKAYFGRLNTTTVIAGSKGEQAVLNAGGVVTPRQPSSKNPSP